jgi:ABC-type transporter MlaC component
VRAVIVIIVFVASLAAATDGLAADPAPLDLVRRGVAELIQSRVALATTSVQDRALRASPLIERYVDLAAFEGRVLSDVEPSLSAAQRKTVAESIGALLTARIAARLAEVPSQSPRIEGPRDENGETHVRVVYEGDPAGAIAIDLVFDRQAPRPRIVDATVAGANISRNLRASVNKVVRRDGVDVLVARLRQLRESALAPAAAPRGGDRPKTADLTL